MRVAEGCALSNLGDTLADPLDRLLRQRCSDELRRRADAGGWPAELWHEVEALGVTLALVDEDHGGAGVAFSETASLLRVTGYHAAPLPVVETLLARGLLSRQGRAAPPGPLALALAPGGRPLCADVQGSRLRLRGEAAAVPWARHAAGLVVIVAAAGHGQTAVIVTPQQARIRPGVNVAAEPRDHVSFEGLELDLPAPPWSADDLAAHAWQLGALARCQQMAGAMQWALERSLAYAGERRQFGRPIGGFQAVQHLMSRLCAQLSAAGVAADSAMGAGGTPPSPDAVACAKSMVGEAAGIVAAIAHQLHGAMGYSQEYPLHHRTRRLWAWRDEFGSERDWQIASGRRVSARGGAALWETLTLP